MQTGLFLEFPALEEVTDQQAFQDGFRIAEEADRMGVESVWLAEYHFIPFSVLSAPVMVATAIANNLFRCWNLRRREASALETRRLCWGSLSGLKKSR